MNTETETLSQPQQQQQKPSAEDIAAIKEILAAVAESETRELTSREKYYRSICGVKAK